MRAARKGFIKNKGEKLALWFSISIDWFINVIFVLALIKLVLFKNFGLIFDVMLVCLCCDWLYYNSDNWRYSWEELKRLKKEGNTNE